VSVVEQLRRSIIVVNTGFATVAYPAVAIVPLSVTYFNGDPEFFTLVGTAGNYYVATRRPCLVRVTAQVNSEKMAGAANDILLLTSEVYDPDTAVWTTQEYWSKIAPAAVGTITSYAVDYLYAVAKRDMRFRLRMDRSSGTGAHLTKTFSHMEVERIVPV